MADPPTVTVRGEGLVRAEPDEVELQLEVRALDETPDAAYAEAARRSQAVDALLNDLGVARDRRSTAGLTVTEELEYGDGAQHSRGYVASNRIHVRLDDLTLVGRLIGEATRSAQARIAGPWWRVAPDNPARAEARRRAARDARGRAEAYSEALGLRVGSVILVAEPGVQGHVVVRHAYTGATLSGLAQPAGDIDVSAGALQVAAEVEVTFSLEPDPPSSPA